MTRALIPADRRQLAPLDQLAAIPEEEIWLAKQKSKQTRRAYKLDVRHFMRALGITGTDELRQAIIAPSSRGSGCSANRKARQLQRYAAASPPFPACSNILSATAL